MVTFACGPYFSEIGVFATLGTLLFVKPLTYWLFILCFRYRVSTPEPLGHRAIVMLALLRSLIGALLLFLAYVLAGLTPDSRDLHMPIAWSFLVVERAAVWFGLGKLGARLQGRRLLGWTLSGTGIDVAFDVALAGTVFGGLIALVPLAICLMAFIWPLYAIGRRPSLRSRFLAANICRTCGYDLTGLAGRDCPECGASQSPTPATPRTSA